MASIARVRHQPGGGLPRPRLLDRLASVGSGLLGLVVAPAGWGKTTLLAQLATAASSPVVWYRAEDVDADPGHLLLRLRQALAPGGGAAGERGRAPAEPAQALGSMVHSMVQGPLLLLIDDLHVLEGTPSEQVLERVIDAAPPDLAVVAASRLPPAWNLSRRRVVGELDVVTGDDLRFRSWEVERLFRDHYGAPLAPEDLAALTRYTEGWAAALHLFHLATRERSQTRRREMVTSLGCHLQLAREYLVGNVLGELPGDLRRFLGETCVMGRLRSDLCDELRGATDSSSLLDALEQRQLLSSSFDERPWFRAHEVLRAHLETTYLRASSEEESRSRYVRAGGLLEAAAAVSDALRAYCRAQDWEAAARLLGRKGEELSQGEVAWVDWMPPTLRRHDPWLLLATARRHRSAGRFPAALDAYGQAERAMTSGDAADLCRRERAVLSAWLRRGPLPPDWSGLLRAALAGRFPVAPGAAPGVDDPRVLLAVGLGALAAGCPRAAADPLARAAEHPAASAVLAAAARLALGAAGVLAGAATEAETLDRVAEELEALGVAGLTRIATALAGAARPGELGHAAATAREACRRDGDEWGRSVAALVQGWARLAGPDPGAASEPLGAAREGFDRLDAGVPAALAASLRALALVRSHDPGGQQAAARAEAAGRAASSRGAQAVATLALAEAGGDAAPGSLGHAAAALLRGCGLAVPGAPSPVPVPAAGTAPATAALRCFGGFALSVGGRPVDLRPLKPKARKVLRLLALHTPGWVHREVLMEALWSGNDPAAAARNLQVAVSSLRHVLDAGGAEGESLVTRQGAAYRLALPPGSRVDHLELAAALFQARTASGDGRATAALASVRVALEIAAAPLLPEDGPEEWVLARREAVRAEVAHTAELVAEALAAAGQLPQAVEVCERALGVDRCSDALWRLLVRCSEAAGDRAAAARARRGYDAVLAELGVADPPGERPLTG